MTTEEVLVKLQSIFEDVFDEEGMSVTRKTSAKDIEDWDSFAQIRLTAAIEKAFDIKFAFGELGALRNVGEMVDVIFERAKKGKEAI